MRLRDLGFLLAFSTALLPWGARSLGRAGVPLDLATWFPLLFIFGIVPLIDALVGQDRSNRLDPEEVGRLDRNRYFRTLTALVLPLWLATLAWCTWQFISWPLGPVGALGWILSTGVIGGTLAINPAHELIHKSSRIEPLIGGILLSSVGYQGFKVEHVRGHHLHVATPEDSSSARLGESVYAFVPRALWRNVRNAWRLESARLRQRGKSVWSMHNEMVHWTLLWLVFMGVAATWGGFRGLLFFLAQGLAAAATLEVINYVEHYGLSRREISPGRYERVTHLHSWNSSQRYTNWLLFNLQRHSDHHETARRRYQSLLHHEDSPQLPAGYASMFVLALLPPLWRRVMDPRVRAAAQ
ncbi:alkane 1-monooxygenase [Rhodanobacter sp. AS-Z3]|uniref:alkane 1-monooxygenase n=1 Tax=Rhodanobacter sp. AS-Z3 TaxID=3031330 RepID=UPI002478509B|nr:alkane 1-monooxygenase [Rhodanobacter sp. AS-Z3]WEN15504.1 alkane 1-monooxygenase [Rhodanobacter sp. AS-Z3]